MKRKLSKTEIVLSLYTGLMDGKEIAMDEFCSNSSISVPTFKRYIQEIRSFLSIPICLMNCFTAGRIRFINSATREQTKKANI
ncbi:MAG: hypothetical protein LKJ88_01965 [Bacilli bacterium]|nr:hypothetical protein [Bacilli bacterium]